MQKLHLLLEFGCVGKILYIIPLAKLLRYEEWIYGVKITQDFHQAYKIGVYKILTTEVGINGAGLHPNCSNITE